MMQYTKNLLTGQHELPLLAPLALREMFWLFLSRYHYLTFIYLSSPVCVFVATFFPFIDMFSVVLNMALALKSWYRRLLRIKIKNV